MFSQSIREPFKGYFKKIDMNLYLLDVLECIEVLNKKPVYNKSSEMRWFQYNKGYPEKKRFMGNLY